MRLLVTRPAEDAASYAAELEAAGHEVLSEPLFEIRPIAGATPDLAGVSALLATSANGVRAFATLQGGRDLPLYAVGSRTADVARALGFRTVENADGDAASLAEFVAQRRTPSQGALLHIAGTARAGDLSGTLGAHGFDVRVAALYEAVPVASLSEAARSAIARRALDAVILFSPRAARHFATLVAASGLREAARSLVAFCLSRAVAEALSDLACRAVRIAARPTRAALAEILSESIPEGVSP